VVGYRANKMPKKFTKNSSLAEILTSKEGGKILAKYNLPCLTCPMARFEIGNLKLGEVCKMYKIDIENLIEELNKK